MATATTAAPVAAAAVVAHADPAVSIETSRPHAADVDLVNLTLLQLCFDEAEFSPPEQQDDGASAREGAGSSSSPTIDFDAHLFIASKLEHVAPAVLEKDLDVYARHLESAVLRRVQEEVHEAFIEVSGQLVSTEHTIRKVDGPLTEIEARVSRCREVVSNAREEASKLLDLAAAAEAERVFCSAVLEIMLLHNTMVRGLDDAAAAASAPQPPQVSTPLRQGSAESLGSRSPTSPTQQTSQAPPAHAAAATASGGCLLEFLCATAVRLRALLARVKAASSGSAEDAATLSELQVAVKADEARLREMVNSYFLSAYSRFGSQPSVDAGHALAEATGLYRQLQDEAAFAELFKDRIVRPVVENIITWRASGIAKASITESEKVVHALIDALRQSVLKPLALIQERLGPQPSLLAVAVWPAISDTIMKRLQSMFSVLVPDTFHRSFALGTALVSFLEDCCRTVDELHCLRNSPETTLWRSKWPLEVYHQSRLNEFTDLLQTSGAFQGPFSPMPSPSATADDAASSAFTIPQFAKLLDAVFWLLDPSKVFIFGLQHRFLRDVCDAFGRFGAFAAQEAAKASQPMDSLEVIKNLVALRAAGDTQLAPRLRAVLDDPATVAAVTGFIGKLITAQVATIRRGVVDGLVAKCMHSLNHVASVKRIFSNNAPMPTQPSAYLVDSIKDVSTFRTAALKSGALSEAECKALVTDVMDTTTDQLAAAVKSALVSAKRQQESLDKLGRSKAAPSIKTDGAIGSSTSAATILDKPREKIVVQLYLDVHDYGDQLRKVGINKEVYRPFQQAVALVEARAKWLLSECSGPEPSDEQN